VIASPLRPRDQQQESGIAARGQLAHPRNALRRFTFVRHHDASRASFRPALTETPQRNQPHWDRPVNSGPRPCLRCWIPPIGLQVRTSTSDLNVRARHTSAPAALRATFAPHQPRRAAQAQTPSDPAPSFRPARHLQSTPTSQTLSTERGAVQTTRSMSGRGLALGLIRISLPTLAAAKRWPAVIPTAVLVRSSSDSGLDRAESSHLARAGVMAPAAAEQRRAPVLRKVRPTVRPGAQPGGPIVHRLRPSRSAHVTTSPLSASGASVSRYGARYWAKTFAELAAWCVSACSSDAVVG